MDQLGSLLKLVFFRVIFNSLVGIIAVIVFAFFINNYIVLIHYHSEHLNEKTLSGSFIKRAKHYSISDISVNSRNNFLMKYDIIKMTHIDNIWIFLIFTTILGEIIIALGEIIIHNFPFEYNALINDGVMERIAPRCFNINNNNNYSFTYNEFISIFESTNKTGSEISELNFVIGGVFAGLGFISLTLLFYFISLINKLIWWLLFIIPLCLIIIIIYRAVIYFKKTIREFSKKDKINLRVYAKAISTSICISISQKDIINRCAMAISISISIFMACFLTKLPNNNISLFVCPFCIISFNILITIFLFYQAMMRMAFANRINLAIIENTNANKQ